jgi:hypothetical protein
MNPSDKWSSRETGLANVYYSVVLIDLYQLKLYYDHILPRFVQEYSLQWYDIEAMFDWCVQEALQREFLLKVGSRVHEHYKHDIYRCVYDSVGPEFQARLRFNSAVNRIQFRPNQAVKVLVAGSNLVIAQGAPFHEGL